MAKKMDLETLRALLSSERAGAIGTTQSSKLADDRTTAMDYYEGVMPDMPSSEGRSAAVSTDVLEAIEALMPPLMEIFAASEDVVRFAPVGPEDEKGADQETDYVNHVFMQRNPGFIILYSFIKDALLSKVGIVKVFWEETTKEERETYSDLTEDEYALVKAAVDADDGAQIIEHTENAPDDAEMPMPDGAQPGMPPPGPTHDCVIAYQREHGQAKVVPIPPEEFLISRKARALQDTAYCAHRPGAVTKADLLEQGFDKKQVNTLPSRSMGLNTEEIARNTVEDFQPAGDTMNDSADIVDVIEHYIKCDYQGDGISRIWKVTTGGPDGDILKRAEKGEDSVECVDAYPFAAMTPFIMTHRFWGRSVADLVIEIQRIKTALLRALLDNTYMANNQRMYVAEGLASERTLDDLLTNRPGGIVRGKAPGAVMPLENSPIGNFVFPMIEYMDASKEARVGITKLGSGLDPNTLQNQTATASNNAFTAAQARIKLIARIFAETGIKDLFSLLHGVIRKNSQKAETIRLRNQWVQVDPRDWKARNDMTIQVGLGTGSKEQQIANLMQIANIQKEALLMPGQTLVEPKHVYNTMSKMLPLMGQKVPEDFFNDPGKPPDPNAPPPPPPPPPPPDPKMIEVQQKGQAQQAQMQMDAQHTQMKMASDAQNQQQQTQADAAIKAQQAEADTKHKQLVLMMEMDLKRQQMTEEMQLKREQMMLEMELKRESIAAQAKVNASVGDVRMGGQVG